MHPPVLLRHPKNSQGVKPMARRPHAAATTRILVNGITAASTFGLIAMLAGQAGASGGSTSVAAAPTGVVVVTPAGATGLDASTLAPPVAGAPAAGAPPAPAAVPSTNPATVGGGATPVVRTQPAPVGGATPGPAPAPSPTTPAPTAPPAPTVVTTPPVTAPPVTTTTKAS